MLDSHQLVVVILLGRTRSSSSAGDENPIKRETGKGRIHLVQLGLEDASGAMLTRSKPVVWVTHQSNTYQHIYYDDAICWSEI